MSTYDVPRSVVGDMAELISDGCGKLSAKEVAENCVIAMYPALAAAEARGIAVGLEMAAKVADAEADGYPDGDYSRSDEPIHPAEIARGVAAAIRAQTLPHEPIKGDEGRG